MDLKGIYTADANRYGDAEHFTRDAARAESCCLRLVWDSGTTSEEWILTREAVPSPIMPSTTESPTSTLPTTMVLHTEAQKNHGQTDEG